MAQVIERGKLWRCIDGCGIRACRIGRWRFGMCETGKYREQHKHQERSKFRQQTRHRLHEGNIRLFHRECRLHVPFAENLLEAFLVYVVDAGKAREVPGILVVVDGDGISLVKDDVACVGVDLLVVARKTARQVSHLLEAAVVVHVERHVTLREEFGEGLGRGIFFERRREGGVVHMDFEFHGSLRLGG